MLIYGTSACSSMHAWWRASSSVRGSAARAGDQTIIM